MRPARRNLNTLARRLSAVAFAIWLGGAGCVFCHVTPAARARQDAPVTRRARAASAGVHCPAHAGRSPEASDERGRAAAASAKGSNPFDRRPAMRCREARPTSDQSRNPRPANERPTADAHGEFAHGEVASSHVASPRPRGRSPDGRATHVRCCVFLI